MATKTDILPQSPVRQVVHCAHCGLEVPPGLVEPDRGHQFCCAGCRAVFEAVHACGLDSYYKLRQAAAEAEKKPASVSAGSFQAFDAPTFDERFIHHNPDGTATTDFVLEGVTCAACVWLVERLPKAVPGVIESRLSLRESTVRITWQPQAVPLSRIARTLDGFGYTPHPARGTSARELHQRETRRRLIHLGVAGAIMGNTMLLGLALYAGDLGQMEEQYRMFFRWISAGLGTISLAWPGAVFFRSALGALRAKTTNLDVPIALALLAGGVAGLVNVVLNRGDIYFDSLTVLVFLLLVGRFIQYRQQRRADDAVGLLFSLTPSSCRIVRAAGSGQQAAGGGKPLLPAARCQLPAAFETIDAPIEALQIDDLIEVRPGELFPADGVVAAGRSSVNQSLLTGESMPVAVNVGDAVHAGSQNVASTLHVRVGKVGRDTRVAQIVGLIERGVQEKPPIVQFADKVGGWFVVIVSVAAALVFAFWSRRGFSPAIDHAVALLIVTCPCVLGLATPLTIAIAIGKLARRDILVKSGVALERLSRGGELLLDKTGTLTEGRLKLIRWIGDESVRPRVAELERRSDHPVGRALHEALVAGDASSDGELTDVIERGDGGISGRCGDTRIQVGSSRYMREKGIDVDPELADAVVVAIDGRVVAAAILGDEVRSDSKPAVASLRRIGWAPSILSGDAPSVVTNVAQAVGIEPARAAGAMSPEEKLDRVRGRDRDQTMVMVGDGVNDSAALAAADVGIAVHGGAEASLAAADVYIAKPGLAPLVDLVRTSRLAMRTIHRNLLISLSYNLLAGVLAATGYMSPLLAAIIMPVSSATVLSLAVASIGRDSRGDQQPGKAGA